MGADDDGLFNLVSTGLPISAVQLLLLSFFSIYPVTHLISN